MVYLKDPDKGNISLNHKYEKTFNKFLLKDEEDNYSYNVLCPSDIVETPNLSEYEIFLFKNFNLNAQKDLFSIKLNSDERTSGFVFPITRLDCDENDFKEDSTSQKKIDSINKYKYVCYKKLLNLDIQINNPSTENVQISDLFPDIVVLILCKKIIENNFSIYNYLPVLYEKKYLYIDNLNTQIADLHYKPDRLLIIKSKSVLKLKKCCSDLENDLYIQNLFKKDLVIVENYLARFMLLYQIIEKYIDNIYEEEFKKHVEAFATKNITVNDLKDKITKLSEKQRVKMLMERIKQDAILKSIEEKLKKLSNNLPIELYKKNCSLGEKIYSFRNKIVHNYYSISTHKDLIESIIDDFELFITKLLIEKPFNKELKIQELSYFNYERYPDNSEKDNWFLAIEQYNDIFNS